MKAILGLGMILVVIGAVALGVYFLSQSYLAYKAGEILQAMFFLMAAAFVLKK